eukprot:TRINITY_DN2647_c0_g2_i1.p1 TRINITY_DN2647_c0_g2~~TRINITY_DN2647_c0_g2_i1.p1  ORF type:complete len:632 (+),score=129.65 TRINITY_DN2647_c0_g2_i1:29-1897(+)
MAHLDCLQCHTKDFPENGSCLHVLEHRRTLYSSFSYTCHDLLDNPFMGWRTRMHEDDEYGEYEFLSFKQVLCDVGSLSLSLEKLGLVKGDRVAILSTNSYFWVIVDLACQRLGVITVPIYTNINADAVQFILQDSGAKFIFCSPKKLELCNTVFPTLSTLEKIFVMDIYPWESLLVSATGLNYDSLVSELIEMSQEHENLLMGLPDLADSDDICTLVYTSGTTGSPKGAMITHRNLLSALCILNSRLVPFPPEFKRDIYYSYLPMAHVFERTAMHLVIAHGHLIGFFSGSITMLASDLQTLHPSFMIAVPRVLEKFQANVLDTIQSKGMITRWLFNWAKNSKNDSTTGHLRSTPIWDKIIFEKIREAFGGRIRCLFSGSASLSPEVRRFCTGILGFDVIEGYGMSENCSCLSAQFPNSLETGTIGPVYEELEYRLDEVPEFGYSPLDKPNPRGEFVVRGPTIFKGYWNLPEKTKEVLDDEGWFKTNDIVELLPSGSIKIIDRKSGIIKNSQGEYIHPAHLENVYKNVSSILDIWILCLGSALGAFVWCIGTPTEEEILAELNRVWKEKELKSYERISVIRIKTRELSADNGELTATQKKRRRVLEHIYQKEIQEMREEACSQ